MIIETILGLSLLGATKKGGELSDYKAFLAQVHRTDNNNEKGEHENNPQTAHTSWTSSARSVVEERSTGIEGAAIIVHTNKQMHTVESSDTVQRYSRSGIR
jgi:hypothetical protein